MQPRTERSIRLAVVQLDAIPQARSLGQFWEPVEPKIAELRRPGAEARLSIGRLFPPNRHSAEYRSVLQVGVDAMAARLGEILRFVVSHAVDLVVFPEYAVPVECLGILQEFSSRCVIVAGLGRIRNDEAVELIRAGTTDGGPAELLGRNASVLVEAGHVTVCTKGHPADNEDCERGAGPLSTVLRFGDREARVCVAVCLDFLRDEEQARMAGAEIVCIPAWTPKTRPFLPDAPRDHVRLLANCAEYGGSTIMLAGLRDSPLRDNLGVTPIRRRHEAVVIVDYDKSPRRPADLVPPENRLVARAELIERGSRTHRVLEELTGLDGEHQFDAPVAELVGRHRDEFPPHHGSPGPFAEAVDTYRSLLDQRDHDSRARSLALEQLVVEPGNRPARIRQRQAEVAFQALRSDLVALDVRYAAMDLYRGAAPPPPRRFDSSQYVAAVLRPIRADGRLPGLGSRYALDPAMTDGERTARVREVVELWERQAKGSVAVLAEACRRLLREHEKLAPRLSDPQWWREEEEPAPAVTPTAAPPPDPVLLGPPLDLRLRQVGNAVHLNWTAPEDATPQTRYRVTRWDGVHKFVTGTRWSGGNPPLGRVTVEVCAVAADAESPPVTGSVLIAPGVRDLRLWVTDRNEVQGRWRSEQFVRQVSVRRRSESPAGDRSEADVIAIGDGFHDPAPIGRHQYTVTPVYEFPDGVVADGLETAAAVVTYPVPAAPGPLSWRARGDGRVVLSHPPLPTGVTLALRIANGHAGRPGEVVPVDTVFMTGGAVPIHEAAAEEHVVDLPNGLSTVVPYAIAGALAVRGPALAVAHIPRVGGRAPRTDDRVLVSWTWPADITLARLWIRWGRADAEPEIRDVSLDEYRLRGGVELRGAERAYVTVAGLFHTDGEPLVGAPTEIVSEPQPNTVTYDVARLWWDVFRMSRRRRVRLRSTFPCGEVGVRIAVQDSGGTRTREILLAEEDGLRLDPDEPTTVEVTVPGPARLRRPCYVWVAARVGEDPLRVDNVGSGGREIA